MLLNASDRPMDTATDVLPETDAASDAAPATALIDVPLSAVRLIESAASVRGEAASPSIVASRLE